MPETIESETVYDINYTNQRIADASKYGVVPEVIVYALKAIKENPDLSIRDAVAAGCREWDV